MNQKTTPAGAVDKPIVSRQGKGKKNEIFVDIYERISVTFNANVWLLAACADILALPNTDTLAVLMRQGFILNSAIDGTIQMKSYLAGNPELRLALNEELVVGKSTTGPAGMCLADTDSDDGCFVSTPCHLRLHCYGHWHQF